MPSIIFPSFWILLAIFPLWSILNSKMAKNGDTKQHRVDCGNSKLVRGDDWHDAKGIRSIWLHHTEKISKCGQNWGQTFWIFIQDWIKYLSQIPDPTKKRCELTWNCQYVGMCRIILNSPLMAFAGSSWFVFCTNDYDHPELSSAGMSRIILNSLEYIELPCILDHPGISSG